MKDEVTSSSDMTELGPWSKRARNVLQYLSGTRTIISRFYLFHITSGGHGIMDIPGIGRVTYQEIRDKLIEHGLPDLDLRIFRLGYNGGPAVKSQLYAMLREWKTASSGRRRLLRRNLAECYAD